jgi:roadblock/LC7 domain-containing protein
MMEGIIVSGFTMLSADNFIPSLKWIINVIGLMSMLINGMVLGRYMVLVGGRRVDISGDVVVGLVG